MPHRPDPPPPVLDLARQFTEAKPMRRGTFSTQYLRCNKAGCPCAGRPGDRHGPYHRVTRVVAGKTQSLHVPAGQAELVRAQVEAGQEFRRRVEAYWQACEQWADSELEAARSPSDAEAAKKGGSKRRSTPKSSARSRR